MSHDLLAYGFAFSSVFTFSLAAIGFTYFSQKVSALWMNVFKCVVSFIVSIPVVLYLNHQLYWPLENVWPFYLSGIIGLGLGDWLLLTAYKKIGPARTLMIFGFQPLIAGTFSFYVWGETIYPKQLIAIIFFVICLALFSYEKFQTTRRWDFSGLAFAIAGVTLDSIGVIISRYGFNSNPDLSGLEAQYLRTTAALISFAFILSFLKINFVENFQKLSRNEKFVATMSSFLGTFLSIAFYMQAIKIGKLAAVTSIALTDPMFSTFFESVWLKRWPSKYLWYAMISFFFAMYFLFAPRF